MPAAGNLMIPKKTKVFVEQTGRERENASSKTILSYSKRFYHTNQDNFLRSS